MRVCDWIVEELERRGVTHVFTLQGGYSMYLNDGIGHSALKPVYMLDERGASFAAMGYSMCSDKMGVCCITSGLAQTNALSGVAAAYSEFLPMLVLSGDIKRGDIARRIINKLRQGGQQDVPIVEIALPMTKYITIVDDKNELKTKFDQAWREATTPPCGPVWLDIPLDVQCEKL